MGSAPLELPNRYLLVTPLGTQLLMTPPGSPDEAGCPGESGCERSGAGRTLRSPCRVRAANESGTLDLRTR